MISHDDLVIVFPDIDIQAIRGSFSLGPESVKWVYFGDDLFRRRNMMNCLGEEFEIVDISRKIRKIAQSIKKEYVQWHDDLNRNFKEDPGWWFGAVSSRNSHQSHIFQYCCFLETLKELWLDPLQRPRLIVVESEALAKSIRQWAALRGASVKICSGWQVFFKKWRHNAYTFLRWGKFWAVQALRSLAVILTYIKGFRPVIDESDDLLVVTTVHAHSLSSTGEFSDRYFPYLHNFLKQQDRKVVVFPFFYGFEYNYFLIYCRLRVSDTRFIIPEDLLIFSDYLDVFMYSCQVLRREVRPATFRGFELESLIAEEIHERDVVIGLEPFLIYKAYLRLGKKFPSLRNAITWHENRGIDRAVVMGLRKSFPQMQIVGVHAFLHPDNYLSVVPSCSEVEAGVIPDVLLTTSARESHLAQTFCSDVKSHPAAALRYHHLFEENEEAATLARGEGFRYVLVLLPFDIRGAVEILRIVREALPLISGDVRFLIKAHPDYSLEQVRDAFGIAWPACFDAFEGGLKQGLLQSGMVISGMSSAMVEAAVKGIPVIYVGDPTSLDENLMDHMDLEMTTSCFSAPELADAVRRYSCLSHGQRSAYREIGKKLRDLFFLPVNEMTMRPYLDREGT